MHVEGVHAGATSRVELAEGVLKFVSPARPEREHEPDLHGAEEGIEDHQPGIAIFDFAVFAPGADPVIQGMSEFDDFLSVVTGNRAYE